MFGVFRVFRVGEQKKLVLECLEAKKSTEFYRGYRYGADAKSILLQYSTL